MENNLLLFSVKKVKAGKTPTGKTISQSQVSGLQNLLFECFKNNNASMT